MKIQSVLILGGGIAGLQAANDLAGLGFHVYLVERSPSLGGRMAQLDKTFPTNDCSMCILAPKMIECASHPNITLLTCAEIEKLSGEINRFTATIRKKSRYIDALKCTGCGDCATVCPVELPSEFEMNLAKRRAVFKPFPQAVPNVFTITKKGDPPCKDRCPAHIGVQAYVQLAKIGKFDEALAVIHETMPFAGTIGRICPHPCEDACTRCGVEEPVAIAALKRAVYDFGRHEPAMTADEIQYIQNQKKPVAVIGAGPAGLTAAYHLARKGYPVTVFEKLPVAGGMLRVGVPAYRLPRDVLDSEVDMVRRLGVKIVTSSPIQGADGFRALFKKGFKAVFIATGAHASVRMAVPGEHLRGVVSATDLLRKVNLGKVVHPGEKAVVVGGGNAAIDASRALVRMGVKEVTILYRRTRVEMPAYPHEVDSAVEEGVRVELLAAPVRIIGQNGRVAGVEAVRMELGKMDRSGRRRPVPVDGSEFVIECDMVVPAIGQAPELDFIGENPRLKISSRGTIAADPETGATNLKGVFAGGDAVSGPATAIEGIAAACRAAEAIHCYLERLPQKTKREKVPVARMEEKDIEHIETIPRTRMPQIPPEERRGVFEEVERGFGRDETVREAGRCLNCAGCSECLECERICRAKAVDHGLKSERLSLRVDAVVVATGFNPMDTSCLAEYGAGRIANVVSGLEFERLLSASGPTAGRVLRPSDHQPPKRIAFIQCVGSRDMRNHVYCSAVCCMHATKEAILANEHDREVMSTVFYTDLRAAGKTFQKYISRGRREYAVSYIRSRPGLIEEDGETGNVRVVYEDTTTRKKQSVTFDMVVLCQALVPADAHALGTILGVELNTQGFIRIPDALSAPVDTTRTGVLAVGFAVEPMDIPESVVQASAAAGRIAELLRGGAVHG